MSVDLSRQYGYLMSWPTLVALRESNLDRYVELARGIQSATTFADLEPWMKVALQQAQDAGRTPVSPSPETQAAALHEQRQP